MSGRRTRSRRPPRGPPSSEVRQRPGGRWVATAAPAVGSRRGEAVGKEVDVVHAVSPARWIARGVHVP
eukprot:1661829-Alexandrium_andersonii.AAC.1